MTDMLPVPQGQPGITPDQPEPPLAMSPQAQASQIKREPGLEKVRIVVVTGYGQEEYRERARKAGCELHLIKPVDPRTIASLIE